MTPVGHYAASALVGTLVAKITGSPTFGGIVAFGFHIPLDLAFNEFYQWGEGWSKKILFVVLMIPAIALLAFTTALSLNWILTLFMGLIGCLPDVFDAIVLKTSGRRFLHLDTSVQMQSFVGSALTETAFALIVLLIVFVFKI